MARLAAEPASSEGNAINDAAARLHYMRQNRDIAKANSALTMRIRTLEQENTRMLGENLSLQEENLKLRVHLERREKAAEFVDNVSGTKQRLQEGVDMLNNLLKELTPGGAGSSGRELRSPQLPRRRRSHRSNDMPEGFLPAITEDRRRSSLGDVVSPRRGSLNFDDIQLLQPTQRPYADSDEESDDSPPACMIDTRPRRRRDSAAVTSMQPPSPQSSPKASKRKFSGRDVSPTFGSPELDYKFSKVSERAASAARRQIEADKARTPTKRRERPDEDGRQEEVRLSPTERPAKATKITTANPIRSPSTSSLSFSNSSSTSSSRKALGPKSINMDPQNSPVKQAAAAAAATAGYAKPTTSDNSIEKPLLDQIIPTPAARTRVKDTPEPDSTEPTTSTGRTARRARSSVNYAEPSLRVKMRREESKPTEAVKGEGKHRRSASAGGSVTPDPEPTVREPRIKLETTTDHDDAWMSTIPPARAADPVKRAPHKVMFDEIEQEIPDPAISNRRRRTSAAVADLLPTSTIPNPETRDDGARVRRASLANPTEEVARRISKVRSISAENAPATSTGDRKQRAEEKSTRRRSMML